MSFEVRYTDLSGRIGRLETAHGILETPAFVPVVHPVRQAISPNKLKKIGFDAVITNAYISLRHYGDTARQKGIHRIIDFDGIIMTDSGGYQVLEYGSLDVDPSTVANFQMDIKSDIPVPLDKPTGYGLDYEKARKYVQETISNLKETQVIVSERKKRADLIANDNVSHNPNIADIESQIWVGTIQGAEHLDLVKQCSLTLDQMGFKFMALGSPVELMEAYEFAALSKMIVTAKKAIPSKPMHLFGAGHPLTIPLAIALGCDTFDSASYMLYAKDNRYMHPNGTSRLSELVYLPCQCPVCSSLTSVKEMLSLDSKMRTEQLALHNLHVLKAEVDSVKQAIMDGRLWEYVIQKARAHPKLMEILQVFRETDLLDYGTPVFKEKAVFLFDWIDQYRPEIRRFKKQVSEFRTKSKTLVLHPQTNLHPFYTSQVFNSLSKKYPAAQICSYNPFLGLIPAQISDLFPASHNVISNMDFDPHQYTDFVHSMEQFFANNSFDEVLIFADSFMTKLMVRLDIYSLFKSGGDNDTNNDNYNSLSKVIKDIKVTIIDKY